MVVGVLKKASYQGGAANGRRPLSLPKNRRRTILEVCDDFC